MSVLHELESVFSSPSFRQRVGETLAGESLELFREGLKDNDAFIRESCRIMAQALRDKALGELDEEDVTVAIAGQKALLQIQLNNAEIATRTRMQNIVDKLITLSLATLIHAL